MRRNMLLTVVVLLSLTLAASCSGTPVTPTATPGANLPNPASVFCKANGGRVEMRQNPAGGTAGICVFPDGSECDEWAYYRGECKPGGGAATPPATPHATPAGSPPAPTTAAETASDGCRVYRDAQLGYSFHYPAGAAVVANDDPLSGLSIVGPLTGGDNWPVFSVSHPGDREEYRPPAGVDLEQWLIEHNMLPKDPKPTDPEVRAPDRAIAGTSAIHLRFERSPQSYAYDRYYLAHDRQLYMIVIAHTADKEDWTLYNHFLDSIEFKH